MEPKRCDLFNIDMSEVEILLEPWELGVIIRQEPYTNDVEIMFVNMLEYYVEEEKYDYAIIMRDEINRRKKLKRPLN